VADVKVGQRGQTEWHFEGFVLFSIKWLRMV